MDDKHIFIKGLATDTDPQYQPEGTYRHAENFLLTAGGHLLQERGAITIASSGMPLVGVIPLGTQDICFSTDGTIAEIGVQEDATYTAILSSTKFKLSYPVRGTANIDYRGHRRVYWGDGDSFCWLDLDAPTTNLPAGLATIPNPITPTISLASVASGGNLPTGIYQAAASLVTASKNTTNYSLFTGVIPILNEDPQTSSRQALDGAPPQTAASGSITFHLDNLDASYSYVQLVVATYTGIANTLELHTLPLVAIAGRTSIDITYYSFDQHEQAITLAEVLGETPNYIAATDVLQKDGHLLAANLKTAAEDVIDWQSIANSIVLGPTILEKEFNEPVHVTHYIEGTTTGGVDDAASSFSKEDYKNPALTENGKGFQRGEVYSFSFTPIVNGRKLDAYHIPASTHSDAFAAYTSLEVYPTGQGYPTGNVKHHRMPSHTAEPLLSATGIRILGVREIEKPDFSTLTTAQQERITGYIIGMQPRTEPNKSILAQGILNPLVAAPNNFCYYVSPFTGHPDFNGPNHVSASSNLVSKEYAAFYSPETSILQNPITAATHLQRVGQLAGTSYGVADDRTGGLGEEFAAVFLDYKQNQPIHADAISLTPASTPYIQGMNGTAPATLLTGERYPIMVSGQNGFALLKVANTADGIPYQTGMADLSYTFENGNATSSLRFRQADGTMPNGDDANWTGVTTRPLYNLLATRARQYGAIEQATYFPIATSKPTDDPLYIFNGDTFIGKVALISATQENTDEESGMGYITLSYFHCESMVNVNYRHTVSGNGQTTLPYYPKSRNLWQKDGSGVMQYSTGLGQANGYNKQYSFTNTLLPLVPKDYSLSTVSTYTNRIIYSVQAVEGEQLDAFRLFKVNDYHDVPKSHGPITSLAEVAGKLYTHTTDCLWRESFNERVTQESSIGEVVLGNGGLFPRPSEAVIAVGGGYAGSQDSMAAITSPQGHFFTDGRRGKVFRLSDNLNELTKDGMTNALRTAILAGSVFRAYYDYAEERYILVGNNYTTTSWSSRNQRWVSYHSYSPHFVYSTALRNLSEEDGILSVRGQGDILAASITVVSNPEPDVSKTFGAVELQSTASPSTLTCTTDSQQSAVTALVPYTTYGQESGIHEVLTSFVNDDIQLKLPRDLSEGRLRGKWLQTTWTYATITPTLLKQLTILLSARSR